MPYYAIFEGSVYPEKTDASNKFYETLSPHLRRQRGLVEEINYFNQNPNDSMLLSSWISEEALTEWQVLPIHLRIQKAAREGVFSSYRIRLGHESESATSKMTSSPGQFMVLYQHPKSSAHGLDDANRSLLPSMGHLLGEGYDPSEILKALLDHALWSTETHMLHVSGWPDKATAEIFEHSLKRVPGDWLRRIAVARDYTGTHRREAPEKTEPDSDKKL
ncbi:hypothetical protein H2198_006469 [Neophaeococcomyces mojaviensis]|uniref:Uncharacterized protein n=1 Tax=Neophaeococcomyces mojaviensis TaxID=3383035 RepID=A0ACC3A3I3_9EURO|nr:hypothetical protein H2198_006469 [Knufia sp. JES_112]